MLKIDEQRFLEFIITCFDDPIDQTGVTPRISVRRPITRPVHAVRQILWVRIVHGLHYIG